MTTTTGGYVTDTAYVAEFYGDHAPSHMNLIAAANGYRPRSLSGDFTWCDYGCGNGITANVLAGCFPNAKFYGIDFLPAHTRTAELLSMRGGLNNTTFIQKSFTDLGEKEVPPLDFAVMHGVLSWINEATRNAVLDDAARRLKPGGLLLTGTNAMPGWAAKLPLRNMVYSLTRDGQNSLERAQVGLDWLKKLKNAKVKYFRDNPALAEAVDELERLDLRYMAHEYFNEHLKAFYFAELKAMMEARGLRFAGCARLFLNMVDLSVPQALQDEFRAVKTRAELEAKRDFIRNETFRRDIWIKGEPLKSEEEWLAVNQDQVFGTLDPLSKIDQSVAFGDIELSYKNEPFAALLKLVTQNAISVREMEASPALAGLSPWTRFEAARLLAAGGQVLSFPHSTRAVKVSRDARLSMPAVNRGLIKELCMSAPKIALAAPNAGTGVEVSNIDAILLLARCDKGREATVKTAAKVLGGDAGDFVIGNKTLTPQQAETHLKERFSALESTMFDKFVEIGVISVEN
ncbi:MAG: methyltransferase regulatory domain-containing protein [Rhodospirillaceae bacterium]